MARGTGRPSGLWGQYIFFVLVVWLGAGLKKVLLGLVVKGLGEFPGEGSLIIANDDFGSASPADGELTACNLNCVVDDPGLDSFIFQQ
jgi:hypothetical protein